MSKADVLSWKNVNLKHTPTDKAILKDLNGSVKTGELLCIMGQSGAGKSSLLSILTGRITSKTKNFSLTGDITMNGNNYDGYSFGQFAGYVRQDDYLLSTLTVQQTFQFQSQLKLIGHSAQEKKYEVNKLLQKLELLECKSSLIGTNHEKSISGGQKKRVAIGIQLLSNPICLILDQPTSGLDSTISLTLMKLLKKIAKEGKIIITTIHQPSTLIFNELQKLLLLSKGEVIYQEYTKHIMTYMHKIGIKINKKMNPADFFMLQISEYKRSKGYLTPMTAENFQKYENNQIFKKNNEIKEYNFNNYLPQSNELKAGCMVQSKNLLIRGFKHFTRTKSHLLGKVFGAIVMPVIISILYFRIGGRVPPITQPQQLQKYLMQLAAFIFMVIFFNFGMNVYDTVLVFPNEKQLVLKETSSGLYNINIYFICRAVVELPITVIATIFGSTCVYWTAGLQNNFNNYAFLVFINIAGSLTGYMMGLFIGVLFTTSEMAIQILPLIIVPFVIYGGLPVNLNDIPAYSSWIQYLSPIRHGYSALMENILNTDKMYNLGQNQSVRELCGIHGSQQINTILLGTMFFVVLILSLLLLHIKKKPM